ncbi:cytosine deaminase [Polynucleobacter sp. SHI8]|uniref:amidohydrolase family protein n=1 Tax=unclassified Polynucleobacter TaxID=2640945 RepID=UPI002492EB28|nr:MULTISPECIES: amidohydrolase family protein [unclassified Polynucleobacter]BDW10392.1 cytosine deaminase [Polynucleobacter sp. SHI2]BDW12838.1 cytosine deaminase [Polynucleobacter sp. SHI8]
MSQTLIRNATIISMDESIGDLEHADLLIENDRIKEIGQKINAPDAKTIDGTGFIVIPGLVNVHMHTWQTALRSVTSNWTLLEYFKNMHAGLATNFKPSDIFIANYMGGLNQINCGTTTLGDWCHNNPTPDHTDAGIDGLEKSGVRSVFFHGSPKPDPKPGQKHFSEIPHPRSEIERLLNTKFKNKDSLVSLGMAILGPHYSTYDVAVHDFKLARELGLIASMHCAGAAAKTPDGWDRLAEDGLLGSNNNIVHGNNLTDDQLKMMIDLGVTFSITPEGEMTQGHGYPITGRLLRLGSAPSLGVDLESGFSGDMFTVARLALGMQRAIDNAESRELKNSLPETSTIYCRQVLEWITIQGAKALKLDHEIGSLSVGKKADIVMIRADELNMWPIHDPVSSVIMQTSLLNIDTVIINGEIKKQSGKLIHDGIAEGKALLHESGMRLMKELRASTH